MKHLLIVGLLLVVAISPAALWAQDGPLPERVENFADDIVEGELVRPDGELIEGNRHREGASLISIREHFIDKMIESVENLN